jgi:hypothetical protein
MNTTSIVEENDIKNDSWMFDPPSMNIEPEYQAVLASHETV